MQSEENKCVQHWLWYMIGDWQCKGNEFNVKVKVYNEQVQVTPTHFTTQHIYRKGLIFTSESIAVL